MRTLRVPLAATVILALFVGVGGAVMAQDEDDAGRITAQMLNDMATDGWNNDDLALLKEAYAPNAVHTGAYFDGMAFADGRAAVIDAAMSTTIVTAIAPIVELEAPDGESRWVSFVDTSSPFLSQKGVVCSFWARDDQIIRHDCLVPMGCLSGTCTP